WRGGYPAAAALSSASPPPPGVRTPSVWIGTSCFPPSATSTPGRGGDGGAESFPLDPPTATSKAITITQSVAPMTSLCFNKKYLFTPKIASSFFGVSGSVHATNNLNRDIFLLLASDVDS